MLEESLKECSPAPGEDSDHDSDDNAKLVIEDSTPKKKSSIPEPTESERKIIKSIEDELERRLEEKASKTNLNAIHVKNIIKHIVTNKNVLALVRKAENPDCEDEFEPEYEPKLTRAKAKQLLSSATSAVPLPPIAWSTPKKKRKNGVHVLLTEELQDEESGEDEEYFPYTESETEKDENEEDRDSSVCSSNPPSVPPPTPPASTEPDPEPDPVITWSEDGCFKVPQSKPSESSSEEANIAKRTRSKLCLTSTPLEKIEEAFIPPDIPTDMCDVSYENDDWMDFLKEFTRPLDEIVKSTEQEDEEQDPEYNILTDEDLDEIDKEELRMDKAVKITKKELNNLIAELFEYTDEYCKKNDVNKKGETLKEDTSTHFEVIMIEINQFLLLEQQIRQHIQLLTQNFILTYQNPEWHYLSAQLKEFLLNFRFLCEGKDRSTFNSVNLNGAINFIEEWEALFEANGEDVKQMKRHIDETIVTSIDRKRVGSEFIPQFPHFMLKKMSVSDVFIYPSLLPKIPFKSPRIINETFVSSTPSEDGLIAFGLEEFYNFVQQDKPNLSKKNKQNLDIVCEYISTYTVTYKTSKKIMKVILNRKVNRCAMNPIKYYFQYNKSLPIVQHVKPLDQFQILPPCLRSAEELPYQWRSFIKTPNLVSNAANYNVPIQYDSPLNSQISFDRPIILDTVGLSRFEKSFTNQQVLAGVTPSLISTTVPEINYQYSNRLILPKGNIPLEAINVPNIIVKSKKGIKRRKVVKNDIVSPLRNLKKCLAESSQVSKLSAIFSYDCGNWEKLFQQFESQLKNIATQIPDRFEKEREKILLTPVKKTTDYSLFMMLPSMPQLGTPFKSCVDVNNSESLHKEEIPTSQHSFKEEGADTLSNSPNAFNISTESNKVVTGFQGADANTDQDSANEKDDLNDINALLIASSTVKPVGRKEPSGAEKKRAKLKREFLANLMVSTPEDPEVQKKKSEMFALAYYDKMRETLELDDYHQVMQILNDYEEGDAVGLYTKMDKILRPKYIELADEFLLFLREKEAAAVSQLIPWIRMNNRSTFLKKLEIYFKDQPAQLRKIYKCLTELSQDSNVSIEKIKNTLLPMFKGNAVLTDLFLQNFLDEQPPLSLLEGPYENIELRKESSTHDDEVYEILSVPDNEDNYGGPSCICSCHHIEDPEFKSRFRHCIRCGTKFVKGKVYIQSGRGLRPATVTFLNNPNADHSSRLQSTSSSRSINRQRKGLLRQMVFSPTKENIDEDTDDEVDGQKRKKNSPGRRRRKQTLSDSMSKSLTHIDPVAKTPSISEHGKNDLSSPMKNDKSTCKKNKYPVKRTKKPKKILDEIEKCDGDEEEKQKTDFKPGAVDGQVKRFLDESSECEENTVVLDSQDNLKSNSPEHQTAESESECCEESSQDNCESDSNSSTSSCNNHSQSDSNAGDEESWTRDEDKLILETFQRENHKERAFQLIAEKMKHRRISQIRHRFDTLMGILMETMIGNC